MPGLTLVWMALDRRNRQLSGVYHIRLREFLIGYLSAWRRHQMETFSALLAICVGNSPVPVNSPHRGQWRRALIFFDLRLNKPLSEQSWGWWFETPSRQLLRQCNGVQIPQAMYGQWCFTCVYALGHNIFNDTFIHCTMTEDEFLPLLLEKKVCPVWVYI